MAIGINTPAQNFEVSIDAPDIYRIDDLGNGYFCPVKSGNSFQFNIKVKNNNAQAHTVSIDTLASFNTYDDWVTVYGNGKSIGSGQTIILKIKITIPTYHEPNNGDRCTVNALFFNAYSNSYNNSFSVGGFTFIVDNTPPTDVFLSKKSAASYSINMAFRAFDYWSNFFPPKNNNPSNDQDGISSFDLTVKDGNGYIVTSNSCSASNDWSTTMLGLQPNTTYTASVTATDLAGNTSAPVSISVTTAPAPPANLRCTAKTFCTANLAWNASAGATSYKVFNASSNALLGSTSSTQWSMGNLKAGSTYKYYVQAVGNAGTSDKSSTLSVTTPSIPTPTISGPQTVCGSTATYTVLQIPTGCSINWVSSGQLTLQSSSGLNATFVANGNAAATVSAYFST